MKTLENLVKAFVGESQARNRYTFYSNAAKKEGFEQISEIFKATADNEFEHAETFYKLALKLKGDLKVVETGTDAPLTLGKTVDNLRVAIAGEHMETKSAYPEFADVAEKEGFPEVAAKFRAIASIEAHHERRYSKLLELVESGKFFKRDEEVTWICRVCGYVYKGKAPPPKCPSCGHEYNFYERLSEEF